MSELTFGKKIVGPQQRDAIHIAVMPVTCRGKWLAPGAKVKFVFGSKDEVMECRENEEGDAVGVLDPYLTGYISDGDRVWLFLRPNTIIGLRHEWMHPLIDAAPVSASESEIWLRRFADEWCFDYKEMISQASSLSRDEWGNYIVAQGRDLHHRSELGEDHDLFWKHLETLTGQTFGEEHREKFGWSCSC